MNASGPADPAGRILVVEDEQAIADSLRFNLESEGYAVELAADGKSALEADLGGFDLVLLDLLLPGMPGHEVCRQIRAEHFMPVIMLTARESEADRVLGFEVGADDFVSKPFSMAELLGRIRALLRRREVDRGSATAEVTVGDLSLDLVARTVTVGSRREALTTSECRVLAFLASRADRPCSRSELVRHLWQSGFAPDARVCDTHVKNLRRKLEDDPAEPRRLVSVRGIGYMLRPWSKGGP